MLTESRRRLYLVKRNTAITLALIILVSLYFFSTKVVLGILVGGVLSLLNLIFLQRVLEKFFTQENPDKRLILAQYFIKIIFLFGVIYFLVRYHTVHMFGFVAGFSVFLFVLFIEGFLYLIAPAEKRS